MHSDVISCLICTWNKVEYLGKERVREILYQNRKKVILSFLILCDLCNSIINSLSHGRINVFAMTYIVIQIDRICIKFRYLYFIGFYGLS